MKPLAIGIAGSLLLWAGLFAQSGTHVGPLFGGGTEQPAPKDRKSDEDRTGEKTGESVPAPGAASAAPEEVSDAPIRVGVSLVNVLASVRDKHNTLVPTLSKEDFEVFENGQIQSLKFFSANPTCR